MPPYDPRHDPDMAQRIVRVEGQIGDQQQLTHVIAQLLYLQMEGTDPLTVHVDSPGGSLSAAMTIVHTMGCVTVDVGTHCAGVAHGAAALIVASGQRGQRSAAPDAVLSLLPMQVAQVPVWRIFRRRAIRKAVGEFEDALAEATGQQRDRLREDERAERRFTAEQAREYGFVDRVGPFVISTPGS